MWATIGSQLAGTAVSGIAGKIFGGGEGNIQRNNAAKELGRIQTNEALHAATQMPYHMKVGWEKAGIHPIYGMGGSSAQFSPSMSITSNQDNGVGGAMQAMGQNISRAAEALATNREKLQNRLLETQVEGQEIENAKKASDLAVRAHAQTPGLNANPVDTGQLAQNMDGSLTLFPNSDIADLVESMGEIGGIPLAAEWYLRNKIPWHKEQLFNWLRSKQSHDGKVNNTKRGFGKFKHAAKTLWNRYR